jgi:hypothetical protein
VGPGRRPAESRDAAPLASGFRPLTFAFEEPRLGGRELDQRSFDLHTLRFEIVRGRYQRVSETVAIVTQRCQHCAQVFCRLEPSGRP